MKLSKLIKLSTLSTFTLMGGGGSCSIPADVKPHSELAAEEAAMNLVKDTASGGYDLISTEDIKKKLDAEEDMVIIDTMPEDSYRKNHIPGAVGAVLPGKMEEVDPERRAAFVKALGEDKNKPVIIYCGRVSCYRSHVGALIAKEEGFTNVLRHPGGIDAWLEAGYKAESK
ncbi:rhodanese-like protein [Aedoeadaptatus nemausensis]|uniref:Rhodanese-like protein n=1 Tax=Aedoeadaptatus nemausensis TaxID=2582829 RepID=A0A6V6Y658_9FIRM|nr:rhodanese-like domain-containing protein [Peptoniphilus nemausensis]CAC9934150.1 rhodanese-like protein [Peptoniphilus nemausensis]